MLGQQGLPAQTERRNLAGLELTALIQPSGEMDPYSGPLGLGLFYERHQVLRRLYLGAELAYVGYYPLWSAFQESSMILGGLKVGYDFPFRVERRFAITLSPYLSGGWYWRSFVYQGAGYSASRPVLGTGANVDLLVGRRFLIGLNLELLFILDDQLRWTVGGGERLGVRF